MNRRRRRLAKDRATKLKWIRHTLHASRKEALQVLQTQLDHLASQRKSAAKRPTHSWGGFSRMHLTGSSSGASSELSSNGPADYFKERSRVSNISEADKRRTNELQRRSSLLQDQRHMERLSEIQRLVEPR
jgi:hypothetical protein